MTDLNETDVERRLTRLREEYGEFPVDHREETLSPGAFEESVELAESGYTGGGYVLAVREPDQAAPLTGVQEALRWNTTGEGSEERSSSGNRTQPGDDDRTVHTLFVVFPGRYEGGHVAIQPGELNGAAWFRELPANLHQFAERFAEGWDGGRAEGGA